MILTRSVTLRDARAAVHLTLLSGGQLQVFTGQMPPAGDAIDGQILLATLTLPDPAGTVADGAFVATSNLEAMAVADGIAAWVRITDADDAWLMDLDAGTPGSGAAVIINPAQIYTGGTVRLAQLRLQEP